MSKHSLQKSYTFMSTDGVSVRAEEVPERDVIVLSINHRDQGMIITARLSKQQWEDFLGLRYDLEVNAPEADDDSGS